MLNLKNLSRNLFFNIEFHWKNMESARELRDDFRKKVERTMDREKNEKD